MFTAVNHLKGAQGSSGQNRKNIKPDAKATKSRKKGKEKVDVAEESDPPPLNAKPPTKRLNIYVFRSNNRGQLGLGFQQGMKHMPIPMLNENLAAETVGVVHFALGGTHCAALTHDNRILTWGEADSLRPPLRQTDKEATPTEVDRSNIPCEAIFTQLTATDDSTFALTTEGRVYARGNLWPKKTEQGEMSIISNPIPTLLDTPKNVKKLASGSHHVLALTSDGEVFSWGDDEYGQLGRASRSDSEPGICDALDPCRDIAAGQRSSFAICTNGNIFARGANGYNQLGFMKKDNKIDMPTLQTDFKSYNIHAMAAGKQHTFALTDDNRCLAWGHVESTYSVQPEKRIGQLGGFVVDGDKMPLYRSKPAEIPELNPVISVDAGANHSIALVGGKAYTWGQNGLGQAGHVGRNQVIKAPIALHIRCRGKEVNNLCCVAAGDDFSIVAAVHPDEKE